MQPPTNVTDFNVPVKYRDLKLVRQDGFSDVCKATRVTKGPEGEEEEKTVAIKRIPFFNRDTGMAKHVLNELEILHHFQAVGQVVEIYDAFVSSAPPDGASNIAEHQEDLYLVMDYVENDLSQIFKRDLMNSEDQVRSLVCQLLLGLAPMHSQNCAHRDLSCKNVLVDRQGQVSICGFGFARFYDAGEQMEFGMVTQWYRAPEVLCDAAYTTKIDIWAVGVLMAEMLTKEHLLPGRRNDVVDQFNKILNFVGVPDAAWFAPGGGTLSSTSRNAKAYVKRYIERKAEEEAAAAKKAEEDAVAAKKATKDAGAAKAEEGAIAHKKAQEQAVAAKKANFRQNFALPQTRAPCLVHLLAHYPFIVYLAYSIWRKLLVSPDPFPGFLETQQLEFKIELSNHGKDFLRKLLRFNPDTRMSAADALAHPWIQNSALAETVAGCLKDHQDIPHFNRVKEDKPEETHPAATDGPELDALNAAIREVVRKIHEGEEEEASGGAVTAGGSTFQPPPGTIPLVPPCALLTQEQIKDQTDKEQARIRQNHDDYIKRKHHPPPPQEESDEPHYKFDSNDAERPYEEGEGDEEEEEDEKEDLARGPTTPEKKK